MAFNFSDPNKERVLLAAAIHGDLSILKKAAKELDKGKGVKETIEVTTDDLWLGALHLAAGNGRINICRYLIEELGFVPDFCSGKGVTPLHCAAGEGRTETVRYLIDIGADPTVTNVSCLTPLLCATATGHCEVLELLLSKGVPVDTENYIGTPLHLAAICNQEGSMEILLEHSADVNKVVANMHTPLRASVICGSLNCCQLLIKAGADVKLKAPIVDACEMNFVEILKCLLDAGADPNVPDKYGRLAIEAAAMSGNMEIVKMLFPITSRLPKVPEWTLEGIYSYVNSNAYKKKYEARRMEVYADFKLKGDNAFRRKEHYRAMTFYTFIPKVDAKVCANRSFCWLHMGLPELALMDAELAVAVGPDFPEAYNRLGAALLALKKYGHASQVLLDGFKLDPDNVSIEKALWEAVEGMKNVRL